MTTHPSERIWAEVVQIASVLHWPLSDIVDLEHSLRHRVLADISTPSPARW